MRFCSLLAFFWWRGHRNQIFFLLGLYLTHRRIKSLRDIYSIGMFNRVLWCIVVLGTTKGLPFHPLQLVSYLCEYWGESQHRPMSKTVVYTPTETNIYIYMELWLQAGPLQLGTRVCQECSYQGSSNLLSHAGLERSIIFRRRTGGGVVQICVEILCWNPSHNWGVNLNFLV